MEGDGWKHVRRGGIHGSGDSVIWGQVMGVGYLVRGDLFGMSARDGVVFFTMHLECGVPYSLFIGLAATSVTN